MSHNRQALLYLTLFALFFASVISNVFAQSDTSGWPECTRGSASYYQQTCIKKAEHWKGVTAPYRFSINEQEGRELFNWARKAPEPLSLDTSCGVAGDYLDAELTSICSPYVATPVPTETLVPTPTQMPTPTPTEQELHVTNVQWFPIVRMDCSDGGHQNFCVNY